MTVVERAEAAMATRRAQESNFWPRGLMLELVAEAKKQRQIRDAYSAYVWALDRRIHGAVAADRFIRAAAEILEGT